MLKTYLFLVGAIFCEVAGTMLLPISQNFTKLIPTSLLTIFYLTAFYLLTFVVNKLPIAIVYATWSGLGIFTIAILGYIFFKQTLAWQAILGLFLIVIGVILVNTFTVKALTNITPITIKNNPKIACQAKVCLKKKYPSIAIVKTPKPLHVAYTIAIGSLSITNVIK